MYEYRFILVVALLGGAAALATDRGRLPLALRGLKKMLGGGRTPTEEMAARGVPGWRRALAFLMIVAAFVVAIL